MTNASIVARLLLLFFVICPTLSHDSEPTRPIQILTPTDNSFQVSENELKKILEADDIKDRYIVTISIAEAARGRNNLLLNFFLQYLYGQVTKFHFFFVKFTFLCKVLTIIFTMIV